MKWKDLAAEPGILGALDHAGQRVETGSQDEKRAWSERFANACAVAVADRLRHSDVRTKIIKPVDLASGTEPLTPLGSATEKRIDVTVADPLLGLEVGFSLKGLNFKDKKSDSFSKNLTGRLYELGDEVRLVHEHLPHAFMVGIFFLPLQSTADKKSGRAPSSFAGTVLKLRDRTGRLDAALAAHAMRCDASFVGLYSLGDEPPEIARGVARFFDVSRSPPRRGRPAVEDTMSLHDLVAEVVRRATHTELDEWSEPEPDD